MTGRKTSCSNAKGDRGASGWREAFRFAPGVSECTWGLDMISLKCGSSYMSFHPCFHFPVPLLSHSSHEGTWSSSPRRTVSKVLLFALPQILFLHSSPPAPPFPFPLPLPQPGSRMLTLGSHRTLSKPPS